MTALPMLGDEYFDEVTHQGKQLKVGQMVLVPQAGQMQTVTVTSLVKRQGHYWVGYHDNQKFCPWPMAQPASPS